MVNIGFSEIRNVEYHKFDNFSFTSGKQQYKSYLLSLFTLCTDINYENSHYDIVNKKSWFHSPFNTTQLKKKTVKMIREGSCIDCSNIKGKLINVTPNEWLKKKDGNSNWHLIYRNGLGYWIDY